MDAVGVLLEPLPDLAEARVSPAGYFQEKLHLAKATHKTLGDLEAEASDGSAEGGLQGERGPAD